MSQYKKQYTFEDRCSQSEKIMNKYPDRVPIIVEKNKEKNDIPELDKHKYLVPADITVGQFIAIIRKRLKLRAEQSIFLFVRNILPPTAALISEIYKSYKDDDGFLYITYTGETSFGY